jgi:thioredoxin 1
MPAAHVNNDNFDQEVLKAGMPVLVDFYAEWCGPCKMAEPIINQLADEFAGKVKIVKLNVDENQEISQQYQVMSIPTIIVFKDGKETERKIGFPGEAGYKTLVAGLTQ